MPDPTSEFNESDFHARGRIISKYSHLFEFIIIIVGYTDFDLDTEEMFCRFKHHQDNAFLGVRLTTIRNLMRLIVKFHCNYFIDRVNEPERHALLPEVHVSYVLRAVARRANGSIAILYKDRYVMIVKTLISSILDVLYWPG